MDKIKHHFIFPIQLLGNFNYVTPTRRNISPANPPQLNKTPIKSAAIQTVYSVSTEEFRINLFNNKKRIITQSSGGSCLAPPLPTPPPTSQLDTYASRAFFTPHDAKTSTRLRLRLRLGSLLRHHLLFHPAFSPDNQ